MPLYKLLYILQLCQECTDISVYLVGVLQRVFAGLHLHTPFSILGPQGALLGYQELSLRSARARSGCHLIRRRHVRVEMLSNMPRMSIPITASIGAPAHQLAGGNAAFNEEGVATIKNSIKS